MVVPGTYFRGSGGTFISGERSLVFVISLTSMRRRSRRNDQDELGERPKSIGKLENRHTRYRLRFPMPSLREVSYSIKLPAKIDGSPIGMSMSRRIKNVEQQINNSLSYIFYLVQ